MVETSQKAKKYHKVKNRLLVINLAFTFVILVSIIFSKFSISIKQLASSFTANTVVVNGIYAALLFVIFYVLSFPLEIYEGFILEHRYNLSNQSIAGYLRDNFKKNAVSFAIYMIAIELLYFFLAKFTDVWWILAALAWFLMTIILAKITPSIFVPLFYKYIPLNDVELRNKIKEMFKSAKVELKDVYMINFSSKTKKLNAAVVGFGENRRVILTDNLLNNLTHEEILSIVAHELGHYKNKDTIKLIFFGSFITAILFFLSNIALKKSFVFFGYDSIADIAGFPLFCLVMFLLWLLGMPLDNAFIRRLETKADIYSIKLTQSAKAFISMMEKLADKNLADVSPSKFIEIMFYDHPPIQKRIQSARSITL